MRYLRKKKTANVIELIIFNQKYNEQIYYTKRFRIRMIPRYKGQMFILRAHINIIKVLSSRRRENGVMFVTF